MKQASKETRERAIQAWKDGAKINDICAGLKINRKTFYLWRQREAQGGEQVAKPKGHYPKKLTEEHKMRIKEMLEINNSLFAREIREELGVNCSLPPIYKVIHELKYTYKKKK